jgi:histidinol phosphatase-like enzyme (inositol monophosphatase family)
MTGRKRLGNLSAADLWRTAHALADAARPATLLHFRSAGLDVSSKNATDFDPVTVADRAAEAAIRATLSQLRPQDAILGEELGAQAGESGLTWIVDPIDGTRGYMCGAPTWGVLIALADAEGPILGIIDQPHIGERFWGGLGEAAVAGPHGRARLATRAARPLGEALLSSTYPEVGSAEEQAAFDRVRARVRLTRYGMDCYAYALLAAGQIDLVIEAGLQVYDIAAPLAVIEAAGGIVTDWQGGPAHEGGQVLAAANREVHAEALALLAG